MLSTYQVECPLVIRNWDCFGVITDKQPEIGIAVHID